jgi:hypothetical protein
MLRDMPSDTIFGEFVLWDVLKARSRQKKKGGVKLLEPLMYQKATAVGWYSGYDLLDVTPPEGLTNAEFDWKQAFGTLSISGEEERKNQGDPAKLLDILEARWEQLRMTMSDAMDEAMFLDGTQGNGKAITGLALLDDSAGTYGNIVRSTAAYWQAHETAVGGLLSVGGSTGMRRLFNDASRGRAINNPNLIITTQAIFEGYEALSDANMRFSTTEHGEIAAGQGLVFKGKPLYYDDYCQSGVLYMLNTNYLHLVIMDGMQGPSASGDFALEPFVKPPNQDAKVAKLLWMGQLTCSNCRYQGKLTGLTNA